MKRSVKILKNGKEIREYPCTKLNWERIYTKAIDIAGGMWNGKDRFEVVIDGIV